MTIVAIGAVTFFINHSSQYSHTLIRTRVLETWSEPTRIYNEAWTLVQVEGPTSSLREVKGFRLVGRDPELILDPV